MKKNEFVLKIDSLIEAIEVVLSKNRSSLSIDDLIRLENVKVALIELKEVTEDSDRKEILSDVLPVIIRTFMRADVIAELRKVLEFLTSL